MGTFFSFVAASLTLAWGCGGGEFPLADAKGEVICAGQPVAGGSVTFSPVEAAAGVKTGKAATASVGPDGPFVLTTERSFDGAVVGKHRVRYTPPEAENEEESDEETMIEESLRATAVQRAENAKRLQQRAARQRQQGVQRSEIIVEVTDSGPNDFTIELSPAGNAVDFDESELVRRPIQLNKPPRRSASPRLAR